MKKPRLSRLWPWMNAAAMTGAQAAWPTAAPTVSDVAAFQRHAALLGDALTLAGQPPDEATRAALKQDAAAIEKALDRLAVAAVTVSADGPPGVEPAPSPPPLMEQGWRAVLVKVVNTARSTATFRIDSPNAQPIPNAPPDEVPRRWLGLEAVEQTPFSPNLSGDPLEYRILTLWGREAGKKPAQLSFNVGQPPAGAGPGRKRWDFTGDAEGWKAVNDCRIESKDEALVITGTGNDPYLTTPVSMPAGEKLVRFRARNAGPPMWQIFWQTEKMSQPDDRHQKTLSVFQDLGQFSEYRLTFRADAPLTLLRVDPGAGEAVSGIDWIEIVSLDDPAGTWATAEVPFTIEPSHEVKFSVHDEHGEACTAGFTIRDGRGRVYPMMSKRLAPDFFFHPQVYRADGETVRLPVGEYTVVCARGPESIPETRTIRVPADGAVTVDYRVKRWIDPTTRGWVSGDHHIHAAGCMHYTNPSEGVLPSDMQRHIMGEDLKIGCNLTWGPCFDFQKQFFTGRIDEVSRPPYLLRYDVEVSGFGSHQSGHLCLLRLKEQIIPGGDSKNHWPTLGMNTLRWAKKQGGVCGPAHSGNGLSGDVGRVGGPDGANGLPNFTIPNYKGIGANEYVVDITHEVPGPDGKPVPAVDFISTMDTDRRAEFNMWYHTLNCGFRVRASGETDFPCITGDRVGGGRIYVKTKAPVDFDDWCEGIVEGRSYVSDGTVHLMDFAAEGGGKSATLAGGKPDLAFDGPTRLKLTVDCAARGPAEATVELIVNGWAQGTGQKLPTDGTLRTLTFDAEIARSSWVAVRVFPNAHTNPIFVSVAGKPIRASRRSAEWLRRGVDQCWKVKARTYAEAEMPQAIADYDHARQTFDRIIAESDVP